MAYLDCLSTYTTVPGPRMNLRSSLGDTCPTLADGLKTMRFPEMASDRGPRRETDEVDLRAQKKEQIFDINMNTENIIPNIKFIKHAC